VNICALTQKEFYPEGNMRFLFLFLFASSLVAQTPQTRSEKEKALEHARALLRLSDNEIKTQIQGMSRSEAEAAKSNVLNLVRPRFKEADRVSYLIEHLAQMSATEREQRRLNNLLLVIILTLVLFAAFIAWVLFDQRRLIRILSTQAPIESLTAADMPLEPIVKTRSSRKAPNRSR